ncbi:MAG: leucine-rich repeat domain-containing protein [Promethearchaeota archaeon]
MGIIVFISYATKDAELFHIKEVAEELEKYGDISEVLYWQRSMKDDIVKYMNDNLERCDIFILFCSPNALNSKPIEAEWETAFQSDKKIIPVFVDQSHIPPLLKPKLGVQIDLFNFNVKKIVEDVYALIRKKYDSAPTKPQPMPTKARIETPSFDWTIKLNELLSKNHPISVIKLFLKRIPENDQQKFINDFMSQIPPPPLNKVYKITNAFSEEINNFFSNSENREYIRAFIDSYSGDDLKSFNNELGTNWHQLHQYKWPQGKKELIGLICSIFGVKEDLGNKIIEEIILPGLKWVDMKWGIEADSEEERDQMVASAEKEKEKERERQKERMEELIKRADKLFGEYRFNEAVDLIKDAKGICEKMGWEDDIRYLDEKLETCKQILELTDYNGVKIPRYEYNAMMDLETLVGNIPQVSEIDDETFGFKSEQNHIVGIGLYNKDISSLPESIGQLKNLQELYLYNNELSSLPERIGDLTNLQRLDLSGNQLSSLPESIGALKNLKELYLTLNQLSSLPESIGALKNLKELWINDNQLSSLPESIGYLTNLKELYLRENKLSSLPESIGYLTNLKELYLRENKLSSLPESIQRGLEQLEKNGCTIWR